MPSPFPGMDPYLEEPRRWPDVHNRLIFIISEQLQPLLSPRYVATLTEYTAYELIETGDYKRIVPDVAVVESIPETETTASVAIAPAPMVGTLEMPTRYTRIEIATVNEEKLVTVIEVLSPVNKRPGADAAGAYRSKRRDILRSTVHLLEIDLLRAGERVPIAEKLPQEPYFIFLSRSQTRPTVDIWPFSLREPIPIVPVPLLDGDPDIPLELNKSLHQMYDDSGYDLWVDYTQAPPAPALSPDDAAWVDELLHGAGRR